MFGNFSEEAQRILLKSKTEMLKLNHPYIGTEHFVLSLLNDKNELTYKLNDFGLSYEKFKNNILKVIGHGSEKTNQFLYTPLLKKIIENAVMECSDTHNRYVTIEHLFLALLESGEGIAIRIFIKMNLNIEKIYNTIFIKESGKNSKKNKKLIIDELGIDLNKKSLNKELDPVVERKEEINRILEILCRRIKNNPLLIGPPGVGKTALVEEISHLITTNSVPDILLSKRIISLDMASLVAGTKYRGEFEDRMKKILKEIEDDENIILFIDEIHTLVGAGGAEGAIDASNILKPSLARGKIRCIGATTDSEYKKFIEKDGALNRRFQKVNIEPPDINKTKKILNKLKPIYEKYHNVIIEDYIIDNIIELTEKYMYDRYQPDKSIDILDEVSSKTRIKENEHKKKIIKLENEIKSIQHEKNSFIIENNFTKAYSYRAKEKELTSQLNILKIKYKENKKNVTIEDVARIIHAKTKIPVYEILNDSETKLNSIKNNLCNNIIGQTNAIDEIIKILKRINLGYKDDNNTYSVLFVGPSGVGKTLMAKVISKEIFGLNNIVRLDMSEYSDATAVNKILGSAPGYVGYDNNKTILDEIKDKPHSIILLDEIEKAHPSVINLFYQILDESKIKTSSGEVLRFDNNIIIMTSNIGFEKNSVGFNKKDKISINNALKNEFSISFINRIDNIIVFNNLNELDIKTIIKNRLKYLKEKYKQINIKIDYKVIEEIIELSNYREFGARKIDKIIKSQIESIIIDNIINLNEKVDIKTIAIGNKQ